MQAEFSAKDSQAVLLGERVQALERELEEALGGFEREREIQFSICQPKFLNGTYITARGSGGGRGQ